MRLIVWERATNPRTDKQSWAILVCDGRYLRNGRRSDLTIIVDKISVRYAVNAHNIRCQRRRSRSRPALSLGDGVIDVLPHSRWFTS